MMRSVTLSMSAGKKVGIAGALAGLAMLALTASPLLAQTPPETPTAPADPMSGPAMTHEQMHQMMDAMHGEGTSQRMHEAMGPDGERLMDQCVAMMGMMGGQDGRPMPGMMGR